MTTIRQYFTDITNLLRPSLGAEAADTARIIFEDIAGYDRNYIFANGDRDILDFTQKKIKDVADKVIAGEPVQYAVGKARFMGMDFLVTPSVLIPRPETEGLVDLITDDFQGCSDLSVLDLCTGSGCIAIALARALPFADVEAVDISKDALDVAKRNAQALIVSVDFEQADVLKLSPAPHTYDIIVSNPPYIAEKEKAQMDARVLDYEPSLALFVPDDNPLLFYKAIGRYAFSSLKPGGKLYFEINPLFAEDLKKMLVAEGFDNVELLRDYCGKLRFARASKAAS